MINYSFIIPHKNSPQLLSRCIHSIPQRNDIEIIVVDDHSDAPAFRSADLSIGDRTDVNYIMLDESRGAGYARNQGLTVAKGKWLVFADADDYFTAHLSALLEKYAADDTLDLVYLNAQAVDDHGVASALPISTYIHNYLHQRIYAEEVLKFKVFAPWIRMVKRRLVLERQLKFDEIFVGNDAIFSLSCSRYATTFACERDIIYNYYQPATGSCTSKYYNRKHLRSIIDLHFRVNQLYREAGYNMRCTFLDKYWALPNQTEEQKQHKAYYLSLLKEHHLSYVSDLYYSLVRIVYKRLKAVL